MKLTEHFSLHEFEKSQTATRHGLDNSVPSAMTIPIRMLCEKVLEPVREHFGKPVMISSGYRSPVLNRLVGGSEHSQHMSGHAADIEIPGVSNHDLFEYIRDNLKFDQLIAEYMEPNNPTAGWVHVSYKHVGNRNQVLEVK